LLRGSAPLDVAKKPIRLVRRDRDEQKHRALKQLLQNLQFELNFLTSSALS